ncbi:hypothetical protein RJT34_30814 [Clitoria ternatea]|uniref:Uncharacterized protein n=1 Tax=Clitoria ternatea TaxID=43366 RepID=A0AAN9I2C0_CLITE
MEKQMDDKAKGKGESENTEGLPMKESPYVQYKDLEEYKQQGYGTQGHQEPQQGRGPGSTEAPTLSGAVVTSQSQVNTTHRI